MVAEVTEKRTSKRWSYLAGLGLAGALAITTATGTLARLDASETSPARGHAQVIAHGVVRLDDGPYVWAVTEDRAGGEASLDRTTGPGFYVGKSGVVLISDGATDEIQRLATGEAAAFRAGGEYEQIGLGEEPGELYQIELVAPDDVPEGAIFDGTYNDGLRGLHDLDLVRDTLKAKEKSTIQAGAKATLVVATQGELRVRLVDGDEIVTVAAGEAVEIAGELEIRATDEGRASYLAVVIGDEIEQSEGANKTGGESGGSEGTVNIPEITVDVDTDGDGLYDSYEEQIGTDPNSMDTDQDGFTDGEEVNVYGTDPLSMDTDGDGLPDYNEVIQQGTDPTNADTDGDSLNDHDELNYNTDPLNPDSDGDGVYDGVELFTYPSDPLDTDTDDDGLLDGDEVNTYGSHPNNTDTDGDGLPDYNEVMQHGTNPTVADTDADGINDHDELGYGTSLTDPDSDDDGALDGVEIFGGTDPLDPASKP